MPHFREKRGLVSAGKQNSRVLGTCPGINNVVSRSHLVAGVYTSIPKWVRESCVVTFIISCSVLLQHQTHLHHLHQAATMASHFQQPGHETTRVMSEAEKADQTHMEYAGTDHDNAVHTPKDVEQPMLDYMHKGTPFEKKVLRKIDWRLVPVLCKRPRVALLRELSG